MDIWSKKWLMSFNPDKTEIMIFSNRSIPENLDFSFNGKSVPITTFHKHLGVTACLGPFVFVLTKTFKCYLTY
jgi:hypothetical protein